MRERAAAVGGSFTAGPVESGWLVRAVLPLRAGAAGFLLQSVKANRLVEAVTLVAAGDGVLAPQVTRRLIEAFSSTSSDRPDPRVRVLGKLRLRTRAQAGIVAQEHGIG